MSLAPSESVLRVKEGYIYGWSGSESPSSYFLTRVMIGIDWSSMGAGETLSYTINVDGIGLFVEKIVIVDFNLGVQPKMFEFVIPPNSTVKVQATQSGNNGAVSAILTGYKI